MFQKIEGGTTINIQGIDCNIPPVGYVFNVATKQLEQREIYKRSELESEQYWERIPLPAWYKETIKREDNYEKKRKEEDELFYDERLEDYKKQEWDRRLNGFWFYNNGIPVYLVGSHYFFIQWFSIDIGYPKFRFPDLEYFYFLQYCIEDNNCMGMLEITKRRFGKTYRGGVFITEYPTRTKMTNGGIQSKTGGDAKKVFAKAVINPFKKLPRFFRPEYDMSLGITPKSEIRFQQTNTRGKKAEEGLDKEELGSLIDFQSADMVAYDGQKLHRYFSDEWAKCFAKGTKIRMYDGSIKNIEDIKNDELVMGDDSTPRKTYGITSGIERMYRIIPNSGESFECNESHILSLKKVGSNETVNISLRDYFKLSDQSKRHLMLWKVGVEYAAVSHILEPYFLGAWLGDGNSRSSSFSSNDSELIEYMQSVSDDNNLLLRKKSKYDYHISSGKTGANNVLLSELRNLNLLQNKHIPQSYLIDSKKNRLELLAGLIDTDGYLYKKDGASKRYEITQKRKDLAYNIQDLARSCGFKATLYKRITTMVRQDGTVYKCDVYKVCIYGELYNIPCKIERKKAKIIENCIRRKNPLRSGFKIEPIGEGEYYGFAVNDNHLFLLADYTVAHNTVECNIYDRHDVIRYCLLDDEGNIIGKALYSSTVEQLETEKDGVQEAAINLWNDSDQLNKGENGRTASGLYRFFMTADRARNFDIYGIPDVEKTIKAILADRATVKHNQRALAARIRKEARTIEEAFYAGNDKCEFNAENIMLQLEELKENPVYLRQCRLISKWVDVPNGFGKMIKKEKIGFMDDEHGGWWMLERPNRENLFSERGGIFEPDNTMNYQIGIDTTQDNRIAANGSDPVIIVFKKSCIVDGEEQGMYPVMMWISPTRLDIHFDEEVLKVAKYYGAKCNYENDRRTDFIRFFNKANCSRFLDWTPKYFQNPAKRGGFKPEIGSRSGDPFQLSQQLQCAKSYIDGTDNEIYNGHVQRIKFPTLLMQLVKYNHSLRTAYDQVVALMMCLAPVIGEQQQPIKPQRIKPLLPTYELNCK